MGRVGVGGPVMDGNVRVLAVDASAAGTLAVGLEADAEARTLTLSRLGIACAAKGGVGIASVLLDRLRCWWFLGRRLCRWSWSGDFRA